MKYILEQFDTFKSFFNIESYYHNSSHTFRVLNNILKIGETLKDDRSMMLAFLAGIIHDTFREDDGKDIAHGPRAAKFKFYIIEPFIEIFNITQTEIYKIKNAIKYHSQDVADNDTVLRLLKDADALDLVRVGQEIDPNRLYFEISKTLIQYAENLYYKTVDKDLFMDDVFKIGGVKVNNDIQKIINYFKQ